MAKPGPKVGSKQSVAHREKRSKALQGENNPNYKDGRKSYRRIAGAEPNDGSVISHRNHDRTDNRPSNLERLNDAPKTRIKRAGRKTTVAHEKHHAATSPRKKPAK